jgi:serine/threonine protein kinase
LQVALALATTLAEVHRRGVIHKDIKPTNILVGQSGDVWLIDFGIATLQQVEHVQAAAASQVEGTLAYMSPEQTGRTNRTLDYRTDFYSLGVVLYEALTGQRPLQGKDALGWFHAHLAQTPRLPHEVRAGIPLQVSKLVLKLLAKGADERYQSAEGLQSDLQRWLQGVASGELESFALGLQDVPARFVLPQRLYGRSRPWTPCCKALSP